MESVPFFAKCRPHLRLLTGNLIKFTLSSLCSYPPIGGNLPINPFLQTSPPPFPLFPAHPTSPHILLTSNQIPETRLKGFSFIPAHPIPSEETSGFCQLFHRAHGKAFVKIGPRSHPVKRLCFGAKSGLVSIKPQQSGDWGQSAYAHFRIRWLLTSKNDSKQPHRTRQKERNLTISPLSCLPS